jgi:hypothetical protein
MEIHEDNLRRLGAILYGNFMLHVSDGAEFKKYEELDELDQTGWMSAARTAIVITTQQLDDHLKKGLQEYEVMCDGDIVKKTLLDLG